MSVLLLACSTVESKSEVVENFHQFKLEQLLTDGVSGGVAILDVDGDKSLELLIANARSQKNVVFNLASKELSFLGGEAGTSTSSWCWGDADNDGDLDFAEANQHGEHNRVAVQRNGQWEFVQHQSLNAGDNYHCTWADLDNDGDHELLLFDVAGPAKVIDYVGGRLVDISDPNIYPWTHENLKFGVGNFGDANGDHIPDLFATSLSGSERLYLGDETGSFKEQTDKGCLPQDDGGMTSGVSWGDYDGDGDFDIFLARLDGANKILENRNGCFQEKANAAISQPQFQTWGGLWIDYDLDGDLDLTVSNYNGPVAMFENEGGSFTSVEAFPESADEISSSRASGIASGDVDGDGDPDMAVAVWDDGDEFLLLNQATEGHSQTVSVEVWTAAGAPAFGTTIIGRAGDLVQLRQIAGTTAIRSQDQPIAYLSVPKNVSSLTVEVFYYGTLIKTYDDVLPGRELSIQIPEMTNSIIARAQGDDIWMQLWPLLVRAGAGRLSERQLRDLSVDYARDEAQIRTFFRYAANFPPTDITVQDVLRRSPHYSAEKIQSDLDDLSDSGFLKEGEQGQYVLGSLGESILDEANRLRLNNYDDDRLSLDSIQALSKVAAEYLRFHANKRNAISLRARSSFRLPNEVSNSATMRDLILDLIAARNYYSHSDLTFLSEAELLTEAEENLLADGLQREILRGVTGGWLTSPEACEERAAWGHTLAKCLSSFQALEASGWVENKASEWVATQQASELIRSASAMADRLFYRHWSVLSDEEYAALLSDVRSFSSGDQSD